MKISLVAAILMGGILAASADQAVIMAGPQNLTINAGSTADFVVTATGALTYQWAFQGTNIPGATGAELNFSDVSTNQAGTYSVMIGSTGIGTNVTASATLTVLQGTMVNFQISGFATGPSNVLVELFDHDKPATVQNFLHYINSGAYSNMFFDRLLPGFVLQGGGYFAFDRTNSSPPPMLGSIYTTYVQDAQVQDPPLPYQVDSEFYVGPKVSNAAGTIAMALPPGNADGAANDFFFNLVDNPFLDVYTNGGGPYTVFGRLLSGSNVLQYFSNPSVFAKPAFTKTPTRNIFTNGIYDQIYYTNNPVFTDLPVNYHGTNQPANHSLFFVDFTFPDPNAQPVIDTNEPTGAQITFPSPDAVLTNGISLTVRGTAQDDVGLARVFVTLSDQFGAFGTNATGTTNWSLFLGLVPPGVYTLTITYQDGAGNLGNYIQQEMVISAVLINGDGAVAVTNEANHTSAADAVGANLLTGATYAYGAQPGPRQFFVDWKYGTNVSLNPNITNKLAANEVLTANFVSNTVPDGITFTYPLLGGNTTNGTFSLQGTVDALLAPPVTVVCRIFSHTNQQLVGVARQVTATNGWSFPVSNLGLGRYDAVIIAQDALGQGTVITNDFTAGLLMTVLTNGYGRGTIATDYNGKFLTQGQKYSMTATAVAGSVFNNWSGSVNTNNRVVSFVMEPGLVLTASFFQNLSGALAFTYPAAAARLTNQTFNLGGTVSSTVVSPVVSYQLRYGTNSATPGTNVTLIPGAPKSAWSAGLTNLAPGSYTVTATVTDVNGSSTSISESFLVLAQVLLQITPANYGTITSNKASWTGQYMAVGGPYALTAKTNGGGVFLYWSNSLSGGLSGNPALTFTVTTNLTISANFASNYFYNVAGTYNGLFFPNDGISAISPTNSGYYSLIVTSNGAINLSLSFPGLKLTSIGQFPLYDPFGFASASFFWKGLDGKYVTNDVNLDLTGGSESLSGDVTNAEFSSSLLAFRATTKLTGGSVVVPGTNVFTIPGDHSGTNGLPGGDSYATFTLAANGAITLVGSLGDYTALSQSTQVSTNYGPTNAIWPFYASLYGGKGIVLGWEISSAPTNFGGEVAWSKPVLPKSATSYDTNAFLWFTNSYTFPLLPPVKGTHYQIAFGGASLTNGLTNTVTVAATGLFTVDPGQTNKLVLTFTPKSGALTGTFSYPTSKITHNLYGAFISPSQGGSGYFLDTNSQTGFFEITQIVTP